jgi:HEAT repeat protein
MLNELRAGGVATDEFGVFRRDGGKSLDSRAAPILLRWLPEVEDSRVREAIARSLTGEPTAKELGAARVLVVEFARPVNDPAAKWALANALSTLADASVADELIALLRDRRHGRAREMLCEALARTGDERAPAVLVDLIEDDEVAGHAISTLRKRHRNAELAAARPKLEAAASRVGATPFTRKQAARALQGLPGR